MHRQAQELQPSFSHKVVFKLWTQLCYKTLGFCCLVLVGVYLKSFFKTQSKFVRGKCGDPGPLQQLPIYRKQYWTKESVFNIWQWLSQSRSHSKVPKKHQQVHRLVEEDMKGNTSSVC